MKLSRYEQEAVINLNADEDEATVYTANPEWTYVLPKNLIRIGKPRTLSEAQLRHLQELKNKKEAF
ncbi:hypothetical protein AALB53_19590 [Lachnospiraceae bacterium 47-T17]